jgi:hypothetical protein
MYTSGDWLLSSSFLLFGIVSEAYSGIIYTNCILSIWPFGKVLVGNELNRLSQSLLWLLTSSFMTIACLLFIFNMQGTDFHIYDAFCIGKWQQYC